MSSAMQFFIPAVIFLTLVAPLWLILHYWTQARNRRGLSQEERELLLESQRTVERLEKRLATLETILDADHEGWRTAARDAGPNASAREH
ncbi:MAG: envelope stress response membrane protein PspB [Gammaproteobacteria bacterium]|uniref:envelope stress response membrane protein PspB n=1 Tax=Pseudomaricurvus alcaniphilus TaxID=1166482 RepID=UPI00140B61B1|nr:envelope stress response membrane protein PspB [Pseudomaricurvus alcaniphilus]MBR9910699.1 envelope stress response membrane protein PspB [Gammaproteobacteria bacterium]NHN39039.1 envelope stress response membrane protein PspB [Pseudomaricurvus alcaniphilus]